jgi:hypothetical protein
MASRFNAEGVTSVLEISRSRLPNTEYVVIICDAWKGDRDDPAVGISRYIAMFPAESAPEELELSDQSYGYKLKEQDRRNVLAWEQVEEIKKQDDDARNYAATQDNLLDPEGYSYGENRRKKGLYIQFIEAIDILAVDPDNEPAWAAVEAYRSYNAGLHEK